MPVSEEAGSLSLRRRFLDGLSLVGGLIAVFQFVVSDNVSSQWFKPARDWIADRLELSEELAVFSSWWNAVVAWVLPDPQPFGQLPLQDVILGIEAGIFLCVLLGLLMTTAPFVVVIFFIIPGREKIKLLLEIVRAIPASVFVVGFLLFQMRGLLVSNPPEWVKITLSVAVLAGLVSPICVFIWGVLHDRERQEER